MSDRTRNPAQKRRGQETGETAANQERRMARHRRREEHEDDDEPAERHMAGKGRGRGSSSRKGGR